MHLLYSWKLNKRISCPRWEINTKFLNKYIAKIHASIFKTVSMSNRQFSSLFLLYTQNSTVPKLADI
jgi:hypothetical protein